MAGELSPDKNYYWDGIRWTSAVSPDGSWRWDGNAWQANTRRRSGGIHPAAIIAAIVIASVVVTGLGAYAVSKWALTGAQSFLQSSGIGVTCSGGNALAGAHLGERDALCGAHLGTAFYGADCTEVSGAPPGGQFLDAAEGGDWQSVDVSPSGDGCMLDARPDHEVMFSTLDGEPASSTLIVDFVPKGWDGGVGLQVACTQDQSCVDFSFWGDGYYSLDEGKPGAGFENLTSGYLGQLGRPGVPPSGSENRLILRVYGTTIDVFLNGHEITRATARRIQSSGYATFYVDGRSTSAGEIVTLKRLFLFETVSS